MKHRIINLFLIASLFIGISCEDHDAPESIYDSQRILERHNEQTWGHEQTKSKIVGQWEWKHAEYLYAIPPDNDLNGMKIEFRDDFTGTITYTNMAPQEFTWSIGAYNTYFGFTTDPGIPELSGLILFSDDIMLCGVVGSGIADGVNNFFQKLLQ